MKIVITLQPTVVSIMHSYATLDDFTMTITATNALADTLSTDTLIDVEERITSVDFALILTGTRCPP